MVGLGLLQGDKVGWQGADEWRGRGIHPSPIMVAFVQHVEINQQIIVLVVAGKVGQ